MGGRTKEMTYFNPKIYNKQNLRNADRKELDFWNDTFKNVIESGCDDFVSEVLNAPIPFVEEVVKQIIDGIRCELHTALGYAMQQVVVACIEAYKSPVEEVENPETYLWEGEEE